MPLVSGRKKPFLTGSDLCETAEKEKLENLRKGIYLSSRIILK